MKHRKIVGAALVMVAASGIMVASASDLVGVKSCKMCHKKDDTGNQFNVWQASGHAKAFEALGTDAAKAAGAKAGVADPQHSGKCLKCHSTAYNWTEQVATDKVPVEEGVSCESCHGAGSDYKSKETMQSREKCIAAGMVYPATKNCEKCHNAESPTWNPERYTTKDGKKVGFDAEQAFEKIKHPNPNAKK